MSNPIDQLKGVDNTAPIVTPEDVTPSAPLPNEVVAQQSVFAGEAGIDPSLYNPDGSLLQSPQSAPNIQEASTPASFPNMEPPTTGLQPLEAPLPIDVQRPNPLLGTTYGPSGQAQIAAITDPVNAARSAEAANMQRIAADGVKNAVVLRTWEPPNLDESLSAYGNNVNALRASFVRQTAARKTEDEKAWLEANLVAIEKMQKPENSATGNGLNWVQAALGALGDATSEDGSRKYVNFLKYKGTGNPGEGEWVGSGIGAVLYGLGLAQNSVMGAALDVVQLYRNVDKGISDAYQRFTPAWARGSTDGALRIVEQLLPQAKLFRDSTLAENRYFDGRSNLVEALRGAQYGFSDKAGSGFGIDIDQGLGTIATWNPNYGKPGQSMFIDSGVDVNPLLLAGVALDIVAGNVVDGVLGRLAAKAALKPGIISKVTGLTAAGWDGAGSYAARGGREVRAVTPKQQAEAAAERAARADRSPIQGEIPFLDGPVPSVPYVPPKLPKGMRPKDTKPARSPVDRGGAVQLELQIQEMMPSKPSAGEIAVRPDAYKPGLLGRKGVDASRQLELRLEGVEKTKLPKAEKLPKPLAKPPAPLQFKFDPFEPGKFNARDFEPKNAKTAKDGTQFALNLGDANKRTPVPVEPKVPKVPVKLDSTIEQLGFDPFNPGELLARGYEAVNAKKTRFVNKKTGNQLTLSVPVESVPVPAQIPFTAPGSITRKPLAGRQKKINFDVMPEAVAPTTRVANPNIVTGARKDIISAVEMLDPVVVSEKRVAANAVKAGMDPEEVIAEVRALRAEHTNLVDEINAPNDAVSALRKEASTIMDALDTATGATRADLVEQLDIVEASLQRARNPTSAKLDVMFDGKPKGNPKDRPRIGMAGGEAALRKEYDTLGKKLDRASERTVESITARMAEIEGQLKQLVNPQPSALDDLLDAAAEGRDLNRKAARTSEDLEMASASYAQELEKGSAGRQMLQEPGVDTVPYPPRGPDTPVSEIAPIDPVRAGEYAYHGTQVKDLPVNLMNPLDGAASSELGLGVYVTRYDNLAEDAAKATRNVDVPSLPSRAATDGSGQVRKIAGIEDLHIISGVDPNPRILELALDAVDSGEGRFQAILDLDNATEPQTVVDILDEAQQAFKDPDTLRAFQRAFTEKLLEDGVDGVALGENIAIYRTAGLRDLGVVVETGVQTAGEATLSRSYVDKWAGAQMGKAKTKYMSTIEAQSETSRHAQALADLEYFKEAAANKAFQAVERSGLLDNPSRVPTLEEFVRLAVSDTTELPLMRGVNEYRNPELLDSVLAYAARRNIKVVTKDIPGKNGTMNPWFGTLTMNARNPDAIKTLIHEISHDIIRDTIDSTKLLTRNEMTVEAAAHVVLTTIDPTLARASQSSLNVFFDMTRPGGSYDKAGRTLENLSHADFVKEQGELLVQLATKILNEIAPGLKVPSIDANRIFTPEAFSGYIDDVVAGHGSKPLSSLLKKSYVTIEGADKPTLNMVEKFATNPITGMVNENALDTLIARYGQDIVAIELPKEMPRGLYNRLTELATEKQNQRVLDILADYDRGVPIEELYKRFGPKVISIIDSQPPKFKLEGAVSDSANYPVKLQRLIDLNVVGDAEELYVLRMSRGDDPYKVLDDLRKQFPNDIFDEDYLKAKADIDEYMQYVNCR